jgi:hypothetical protein
MKPARQLRDYSSKGLDPDGGCGEGEEEKERTAQTSCRGKARPKQNTMEGIEKIEGRREE